MKIEQTPLGQARKAIDAALSDINDALEAWSEAWSADRGGSVEAYPYGDFEVELRPDSSSLGFEAVFQFSEDSGPNASVFTQKLAAIFERHGIATVSVVGTNLDSDDVEAFKE